MPRSTDERACPYCGEPVSERATRCPSCREDLADEEGRRERAVTARPESRPAPRRGRRDEEDDYDDEDDVPRRRRIRKDDGVEPSDFLVPTNVSGWAIASCYMGLVGLLFPLIGLLFAVPAFLFGIIAVTRPKRGGSYGAVTSNVRAVIGLVLSGIAILLWGGVLLLIAAKEL
jgi:hypothetical protein